MSLIQNAPDESGDFRPAVENMSTDEMLREIVITMRNVEDGLSALAESPMVQAMMTGGNPIAAMLRG